MKKHILLIYILIIIMDVVIARNSNPDSVFNKIVSKEIKDWKGAEKESSERFLLINTLDFSEESIDELSGHITKCKNLKSLNLLNNSNLDWYSSFKLLEDLEKLEDIKITATSLDSIPRKYWYRITGFHFLISETYYSIKENKKNFEKLCTLKQLTYLVLSYKPHSISYYHLGELPESFYDLTNLKYLDLGHGIIWKISHRIKQLEDLETLILHRTGLQSLPNNIRKLPKLSKLDISRNNFQKFPKSICKIKNLTELDLSNNKLKRLPNKVSKLENLTDLDVSKNKLRVLPITIEKLNKLQRLNVSDNNLKKLRKQTCNVKSLTYLNIAKNSITELPAEIGLLEDLIYLDISYNKLSRRIIGIFWKTEKFTLPKEIGQLKKLEVLNISKLVRIIPPEVWELSNLKEFICDENYILTGSFHIKKLKKLELLSLNNTRIRHTPKTNLHGIGELSQLKVLRWSGGELTKLPFSFSNLKNLDSLDLSSNNLTSIPESIGNSDRLTYMNLSNNRLKSIPASIGNIGKLSYLDISHNKLIQLPASIGNLDQLTYLNLRGIGQKSIPASIGNLEKLIYLDLSRNQLTQLPVSIGNLKNIRYLNLKNNHLTEIPVEIGNLTNLTDLLLKNNKLTTLPSEIGNLSGLKNIYLSNNKIVHLPLELGKLHELQLLDLKNNNSLDLSKVFPAFKDTKKPVIVTIRPHYSLIDKGRLKIIIPEGMDIPKEISGIQNLLSLELIYGPKKTRRQTRWRIEPRKFEPIDLSNLFRAISGISRPYTITHEYNYYDLNGNINITIPKSDVLPPEIGLLKNLDILIWDKCRITHLPSEIGNLTELSELHLGGNKLSALPAEIGELKKLIILDLSYNQLENLPNEICQLQNLSTFKINNNLIKRIPDNFSNLKRLRILELSNNSINELSKEICQLNKLNTLELMGNQIEKLPYEIGNLKNLFHLKLAYNNLSLIPKEIGKLINLQTLILHDNKIIEIPKEIGKLIKLKTLYLDDNKITEIPEEICNIQGIETISLSNNQLSDFPDCKFWQNNLRQIYLSGNKISSKKENKLFKKYMIDGRDRINSNPYSYYGSDLELKYIFEFMAESELKGSKRAYLQYRSYNEIDFEKIDSLIKTYDESIRITVLVKDYNLISLSNNISANIAFDWILNNPFIEELFIIAPKLRELGKVDINMFDLEELVIYSPLTCLPDSFCKLQSLRRIEFFCPFFKQVPMQIFDLGHLEEITFFGSDSLILDVTEDKKGTSLRLEIIYIISSKDFEIKKSFFNNLEDVWVNISDCKNVKIESSRMKRKNSIRVLKYR